MAIDNLETREETAAQEPAKKGAGSAGRGARSLVTALIPVGIAACLFSAWLGMRDSIGRRGAVRLGRMCSLQPMVVRLADASPRYLRVSIVLEAPGRGSARAIRRAEQQIADALVSLLGARRFDDLNSPMKRRILKAMIADTVNATVENSAVANVYFAEFRLARRYPVKAFQDPLE